MIDENEIKQIYTEYLANNGDGWKKHIYRFWINILNIERYDLVSKSCLNPVFREILKKHNIKKSSDFYIPLKYYFFTKPTLYFDKDFNLCEVENE